jgi:hypothetical protein
MSARRFKFVHAFALVVWAIAAGSAKAQVTTNRFDWISLERTPCFGKCPVYSIRIGSDGTVLYDGMMHVTEMGDRVATVTAEELAFLNAAVRTAKFQAFNSTYASRRDGCKDVGTDAPGLKITIRQNSSEKSVFYSAGCVGGPAEVTQVIWLANTIDRVARTERWVAAR